ncbi:MAG: WhiB family transcriptional regulator [Acidimicrobiaceae bacterium]|nr:WhiB family transcriptional regulator [Acidimicrobiaceae bacterium]
MVQRDGGGRRLRAAGMIPDDVGNGLLDTLALLQSLAIKRPDWWAKAACRGFGTEAFFADNAERAKATCRRCPVQLQCAEAGEGQLGTWGGLTERERRQKRRLSA